MREFLSVMPEASKPGPKVYQQIVEGTTYYVWKAQQTIDKELQATPDSPQAPHLQVLKLAISAGDWIVKVGTEFILCGMLGVDDVSPCRKIRLELTFSRCSRTSRHLRPPFLFSHNRLLLATCCIQSCFASQWRRS